MVGAREAVAGGGGERWLSTPRAPTPPLHTRPQLPLIEQEGRGESCVVNHVQVAPL